MMDWILNREPFFRTPEDVVAYMSRELPPLVPLGWKLKHSTEEPLTWVIDKAEVAPGAGCRNYRIRIAAGLRLMVFFHGNSDHGAFGLHHVLERALVIETRALRGFPLSDCVGSLFANFRSNVLGLT